MIDERRQVLQIAAAGIAREAYDGSDVATINLDLASSDLVLFLVEHPEQGSLFADSCAGLRESMGGSIHFLGREWRSLPPDIANALRGQIGRLFYDGNWITRLSLLENILLQQRHHTRYPAEHHLREASRLARRFGLPGVPMGRPEEISASDLQLAAAIRAFLGRPAMILLEEPTRGLPHKSKTRLINVIREARDRGAAVIWMTLDHSLWQDGRIPATRRLRWMGPKVVEARQK